MFIVILASIAATALAGILAKFGLERWHSQARISWREFGIGMAIAPVVAGLISWGGWAVSKQNQMTFTEYRNGWEIQAVKTPITCEKDGSCKWEYHCEPYQCNPHDCNCTCTSHDKDGNCTSTSCQTCYDTCYHDCPYVKTEYDFTVSTTLGSIPIADHVFPLNPESYRWTKTSDYESRIPAGIISQAGTGEPPPWVAAKTRCEAAMPGPVTIRGDYVNYVLASEHTLMKEHSSDIADYQGRKLLPELPRAVHSYYRADKVQFVGWQPSNPRAWQEALEYLNGNFGLTLQGDLFMVVVRDAFVASNPERYGLALKAFWQDKAVYNHDALAKNATVILVGTADGQTVSWSRTFTGMPLGNERFIVTMRDALKGLPLTSDALIGPARSRRDAKGVQYPPEGPQSQIQRILWGLDDAATKFKRVSMSGKDGQGGFLYLKNEIQPSSGQVWAIFLIAFLLSSGAWVWAAMHYDPTE